MEKRFSYGENMAHRLTRLHIIFLTIVFFLVFGVCQKLYKQWSSTRRIQVAEQPQETLPEIQESVDTDLLKKLEQKARQQIAVTGEKIKLKKKYGFDVSSAVVMLKNAKNSYDLSDFENALEYARESSSIADTFHSEKVASHPIKIYVVKRGDTLWDISKKHYKKGAKWYDVWKVNKEKIPDFDRIYRGQKITIPDSYRQNQS
ncbi:MAG: LysM peptidoglycan-binding domain-containing protein [Elusimicrobiota bacterium]|nr:LysM peptidoglycan-binding domain-containing protein [Elusimicrobiota bacterium]